MENLSSTELKTLRSALLDRRAALDLEVQDRERGESRVEAAIERYGSMAEVSREETETRDMEFKLSDRNALELAEVNQALARADAGTYGVCVDCGVDIPYSRLVAQPAAERCVQCQTERERRP